MALFALNSRHVAFRGVPLPNAWLLSLLLSHRKSTNVDAIDSFISELMENKAFKWKVLNNKHKLVPVLKAPVLNSSISSPKSTPFRLTQIFNDLTSNPILINIELLEQTHIDNLVDTAIKEENDKDVKLLLDQMLEYEKLPSTNVLNMLLEYLANTLDRNRLEKLVDLCHKVSPKYVAENCNMLHYKAILLWKSGNSLNSLDKMKEALVGCTPDAKVVIDRLLINIVDETIGRKSEAVLLAVIEMGEFCLKEMNDSFLICYVWERSFHSQWYSDQEAAKAMFDKHESLRLAIAKRINSLCFAFMQDFNTEPVYRLMELFLKHNMLPQCRLILICLFEYQYWRRNLRACSEIIQNSIDLDLALPEAYNRKLLDLLLGRSGMQTRPSVETEGKRKQKLQAKKYELKF
ncbi:uncharacterized protein LOC135703769 [Ochlerotatus camptorhynchus]|uniref:uncharacterized protein LOC135703769 n=1 Tax=Ochlerotatus camptorhynchus TaxID=644619 RepID=UPI0031DB146C